MEYLNKAGLAYFWGKIKAYVATAISGKANAEPNTNGAAAKAVSIPFGEIDTANSTNAAYVANVDEITSLRDGVCFFLKVNAASAYGATLNVNGLGAKPIYRSLSNQVVSGNELKQNATYLFVYNTSIISGGCWYMYAGLDTNDTASFMTHYQGALKVIEASSGNMLLVTCSDTELLPIYSGASTQETTKTLTTESFNPFGSIFYRVGANTKDSNIYLSNLWQQYYINLSYAFNIGTSLTLRKSVYMVCDPQSDGKVKLAANPISQDLPTTEDGKVYIFLGIAYSNNSITLFLEHPVYYFKDGAIRLWTNQDQTALKLGTSTIGGATQGIFLNQGVPAACESYDMWYMKHIAALYGATRNDATGLWSYYYRGCARWDDTQEKIVWDRYIGYDDITDEEMMSMVDHRLTSLASTSVYGSGKGIISRIAFHFIGYGNNQGGPIVAAYVGNRTITTYGYVGQKGSASGGTYFSFPLTELNLVYNVKHIIGRSSYGNGATAPDTATKLEYVTISYGGNNRTIDFSVCPNLEFVSVMYTVSNGLTYTGCTLILHPDVYAKIFDSTNEDYPLWHKIDLANQARTNPITIQSA